MKFDQKKINQLARHCQKHKYISEELFDSVRYIAVARFMGTGVRPEDYEAYTCLAIEEGLKYWDPTLEGNFSMYIHQMCGHQILYDDRKWRQIVHLPTTHLKDEMKVGGYTMLERRQRHVTSYPDGYTSKSDNTVGDGWNFLDSKADTRDKTWDYKLKDIIDKLDDTLKKIYTYRYIHCAPVCIIAEAVGVSDTTIKLRIKELHDIVKKQL